MLPTCPRSSLPWVIGLVALTAACSLVDQVTGSGELAIKKFAASSTQVAPGSTVTLTWDVQGADVVQIDGVGTVTSRGQRDQRVEADTTFRLHARSGDSAMDASVVVRVGAPIPSPSPSASPSPSPQPSPTPSASPTPGPSPSASPSGQPMACGKPVTSAGSCMLTIDARKALPAGECLELTAFSAERECPVYFNVSRRISFTITSRTSLAPLSWRRGPDGLDLYTPAYGSVDAWGYTTVTLDDLVLGDRAQFEVVDPAGTVWLRFSLRHH